MGFTVNVEIHVDMKTLKFIVRGADSNENGLEKKPRI
jgi:hypothetical protein